MATRGRNRANATARKRRWRNLLRSGGAVLRVPVRDLFGVIDVLLEMRWLAENESEDRREMGAAIGALLDDLSEWKRRRVSRVDRQVARTLAASTP